MFRYQRRALSWLRWRETFGGKEASESGCEQGEGGPFRGLQHAKGDAQSIKARHPPSSVLWQPIKLSSGETVHYNVVEGRLW